MSFTYPHPAITPIPNNDPYATPGLWNIRYTQINENFEAVKQALSGLSYVPLAGGTMTGTLNAPTVRATSGMFAPNKTHFPSGWGSGLRTQDVVTHQAMDDALKVLAARIPGQVSLPVPSVLQGTGVYNHYYSPTGSDVTTFRAAQDSTQVTPNLRWERMLGALMTRATVDSNFDTLQNDAPVPVATSYTASNSQNRLATTAWVRSAIASIINSISSLKVSVQTFNSIKKGTTAPSFAIASTAGYSGVIRFPAFLGGLKLQWITPNHVVVNGGWKEVDWPETFTTFYTGGATGFSSDAMPATAHLFEKSARIRLDSIGDPPADLNKTVYVWGIGK